MLALDGLVRAVPTVQGNAAYHRVTRAARAALEAAAQVVLSEAQWRHVDDVLAAFVPDFGREQSDAERGELIKAVVQALTVLHGRAAPTSKRVSSCTRAPSRRSRSATVCACLARAQQRPAPACPSHARTRARGSS